MEKISHNDADGSVCFGIPARHPGNVTQTEGTAWLYDGVVLADISLFIAYEKLCSDDALEFHYLLLT